VMPRTVRLLVPCALLLGVSCRSSQPAPAPAPAPAAAPRGDERPPEGRGEMPPEFRRRRVPLTPEQRAARRDSLTADRQRLMDEVLKSIVGRENDPAGQVFKNVKLLKNMPAGEFVKQMNDDYGKAIGRSCNFCHDVHHWDSDERHEKTVARMMIAMEDSINDAPAYLPQLKNRRGFWPHIECVTCHRGMNEPNRALLPP
ncbi:MAG: photosynthetic reaction center cytochrome c subunit, partial [Gemmatimonadota bacterium]|nr:photosynthetic reaction center cytochrome c subunit [Gemmatimonadota bacterium]